MTHPLSMLGYWPGISALAPTTWTTALRTGDGTTRKDGLANLAAGTWGAGALGLAAHRPALPLRDGRVVVPAPLPGPGDRCACT
ncbi:hypothetical protein AB0A71_35530 [Kitasatospora aureofaciens]|uniref:hypothetical protein n=1 Tax=Kitasatospora aureofaciens TaxID=1894 RepID=UPI0033DB0516